MATLTKVQKTIRGAQTSTQGDSIQALPLNTDVHTKFTVTGVSQVGDFTEASIVRLASSVDVYIAWGDSSVSASGSDVYFPSGVEVLVVPQYTTHLAIVQVSVGGPATATKLGDN